MARIKKFNAVGTALGKAFPITIVASAPPTAANRLEIGQLWVDKVNFDLYSLNGYQNGSPQWVNAGGGSGIFTSLTVNPGPTNITGTANFINGDFTITAGTHSIALNATSGNIGIGATLTSGDITIGATGATTGDIIIGPSASNQILQMMNGDGDKIVLIQNGNGDHVFELLDGDGSFNAQIGCGDISGNSQFSILNGITAADWSFSVGSGAGSAGAGIINLGNNARLTTFNIANIAPAANRTTTIGGGIISTGVLDEIRIGPANVTHAAGSRIVYLNSGNVTDGVIVTNIGTGSAVSGTHIVNISTGVGGGIKTINMGASDGLTTIGLDGNPININASADGSIFIGRSNLAGDISIATAGTFALQSTGGLGVQNSNGNQVVSWIVGTGSPDGVVSAGQGSLFSRVNGTADTMLYVNTDGATAWTALTST